MDIEQRNDQKGREKNGKIKCKRISCRTWRPPKPAAFVVMQVYDSAFQVGE